MERINLKELFEKKGIKVSTSHHNYEYLYKTILEVTKEACQQTLELAAENADIYIPDGAYMDNYVNPDRIEIDKSSILNTINQIQ